MSNIKTAVILNSGAKFDKLIPTLIVTGAKEILTLVEHSEKLHQGLDNSKLVVVPGTKDMLPVAKNKYVGNLVREFIA